MVETEEVASGAQTANGTSTVVILTTNSMLGCTVELTAGTAVTHFSLWVQCSNDRNNWFASCADLIVDEADTYTQVAARTNARNIINDITAYAAQKTSAVYKHFPWKYARARWFGTFTSITFSCWLSSK